MVADMYGTNNMLSFSLWYTVVDSIEMLLCRIHVPCTCMVYHRMHTSDSSGIGWGSHFPKGIPILPGKWGPVVPILPGPPKFYDTRTVEQGSGLGTSLG